MEDGAERVVLGRGRVGQDRGVEAIDQRGVGELALDLIVDDQVLDGPVDGDDPVATSRDLDDGLDIDVVAAAVLAGFVDRSGQGRDKLGFVGDRESPPLSGRPYRGVLPGGERRRRSRRSGR
ncbi:MAG: hypothetical protein R3A46_15415 [Thermomicrobiales bacterium]